jgi:hypothetical protein
MTSEIRARAWSRAAAGFFFVAAFLGLAVAGVHPPPSAARFTTQAPAASRWVPPGMHEAQAGVDVGPGSDEALLVTSPQPE